MSEKTSRLRRARDSQGARLAILESAEAVFAEQGFGGARVEAIAKGANYNISLLFQYFGDKLGLYAAVLQRAQRETAELQAQVLAALPADAAGLDDAPAFRKFLASAVAGVFDYLVAHPRLPRVLAWEMAGGWQTYARLAGQFPPAPAAAGAFETAFARARQAGWLRTDWPAPIQLTLIFQVCQSVLAFGPLYQTLLPGRDLAGSRARARERARVVAFVVGGLLVDQPPRRAPTRAGGKT
jgi:AcrR family transcriptional regulator